MKQYVVDAFTDKVFAGNPAAVCVMESWISDDLMMSITKENNLSETAFAVKISDKVYKLRWFTPGGEIDLCGHATLATAFVIMNYYEPTIDEVCFKTLSGELIVKKKDELFEMEFPSYDLREVDVISDMEKAIGYRPLKAFIGRDLLCVLENENQVRNATLDLDKVKELDGTLLHITAPGKDFDCVSRSFAPKLNVPEDPVCGSGHCHIIPFWAEESNKKEFIAYQASERGGILYCEVDGNKTKLSGKAVVFSESEIFVS